MIAKFFESLSGYVAFFLNTARKLTKTINVSGMTQSLLGQSVKLINFALLTRPFPCKKVGDKCRRIVWLI